MIKPLKAPIVWFLGPIVSKVNEIVIDLNFEEEKKERLLDQMRRDIAARNNGKKET